MQLTSRRDFMPDENVYVRMLTNYLILAGLDKFDLIATEFLDIQFYLRTRSGMQNRRSKPNCASDRETTGNISFCFLLPKWDLRFSFLM